jgi:hypothetical protein
MHSNFDWEVTTFTLSFIGFIHYIDQQMLLIKYIKNTHIKTQLVIFYYFIKYIY